MSNWAKVAKAAPAGDITDTHALHRSVVAAGPDSEEENEDTQAAAAVEAPAPPTADDGTARVDVGTRILTGGVATTVGAGKMTAADDDGRGWISATNLQAGGSGWSGEHSVKKGAAPKVGCVTTDFTMQNLLLHIGMSLISLQGRAVTRVKQWVLKCDACFKICHDTSKVFCPMCGNNTLARLGLTISKSGKVYYHYKKGRRINTRGTKVCRLWRALGLCCASS